MKGFLAKLKTDVFPALCKELERPVAMPAGWFLSALVCLFAAVVCMAVMGQRATDERTRAEMLAGENAALKDGHDKLLAKLIDSLRVGSAPGSPNP